MQLTLLLNSLQVLRQIDNEKTGEEDHFDLGNFDLEHNNVTSVHVLSNEQVVSCLCHSKNAA